MPGLVTRLFNTKLDKVKNPLSYRRFVYLRQKSPLDRILPIRNAKGHSQLKMKQPGKAILTLLVGKTHCVEAIKSLHEIAICLAQLLSRQCKVHTSQRVYRSLQLYSSYSRMWGEEMTHKVISKMRQSLMIGGKAVLLSAVVMTPFNWEQNKISDVALESCIEEYETVEQLCRSTIYCEECHKRQVVDRSILGVDYCTCNGSQGLIDRSRQFHSWEAFLERENILVWRKKHKHLYAYKVFGTYDDTSLSAFMETQLNPSLRTQWDSSALELKIISSHPSSNSDLMYWLVKFPRFFANRDYVFKRRFRVNERKKEVVIVNEIVDHSHIPESNGIHRVKEYWSMMVLRANEDFNKPGMSYTLTYFDDPGTSLPSAFTDYIASKAFPEFLQKVHLAALNLQCRWEEGEDVYVNLPAELRFPQKAKDFQIPNAELESETLSSVLQPSTLSDQDSISMDPTNDSQSENSISQSPDPLQDLRFRKAVVNLLEALEVVSPEYEEKTTLAIKIEEAVDKLGLDRVRRNKLVQRLETLRHRTRTFISDAAKKREESIRTMKEFERRKRYYDEDSSPDESTILLVTGLLKAVNDVLKADKDMRTGKGLAQDPDKGLEIEVSTPVLTKKTTSDYDGISDDPTSSESMSPINVSNVDALAPTVAFCDYCQLDSGGTKEVPILSSNSWYFSFFYSWWGSNVDQDLQTDPSPEVRDCSINEMADSEDNQSWYHYLWLFSRSQEVSRKNTNGDQISEKNSIGDPVKESVPWYFFPWLPKFGSKYNA